MLVDGQQLRKAVLDDQMPLEQRQQRRLGPLQAQALIPPEVLGPKCPHHAAIAHENDQEK